ncbi:MAG TPA: S1C family serine protease [Longilinea sp.]|nr:S1C family serine protease [Longilinea sp.]
MSANLNQSLLASFSDDLTGLIEVVGRSVLSVDARRKFPASGFAFTEDLIVTADHIIEREEGIRVANGVDSFLAILIGRDPHHDLALLKIEGGSFSPLPVVKDRPKVGSLAIALARPGRNIQASFGMLSSIGEWPSRQKGVNIQAILRAEVTAHPGFSGGPLLDSRGDVIGMNTSAISMGGLATLSMSFMKPILEQLKTYGHLRHGYLGVRFQAVELGSEQISALGRDQKFGLLVSGVEADSPAAKGKLLVGDILVGLAGEEVNGIESLQVLLESDLIGKKTMVELIRGNVRNLIEVEIGER